MPVSGDGEPKNIARQPSSCYAGVPIKKRRFPLVQPSSPPSQQPSSAAAKNDHQQKTHSNPSQESALLSASVAMDSPGISDPKSNSLSEFKLGGSADTNINLIKNNFESCKVKIEEPSPQICAVHTDNMDDKEKLMSTDKSALQKISRTMDLHLAPNEALAPNVGKEILGKQKVEGDCKLELADVPGNTELSLGLKAPIVSALAVPTSEGRFQVVEKLGPPSLCLTLSKESPITKSKSDNDNTNPGTSHLHSNRSNWDLNTTMDTWDDSVGNIPACQGTLPSNVLRDTGSTCDVKPSALSATMVGIGADSEKQILDGGEFRSDLHISSLTPTTEQYKSEDSLHLRLSTSCLHSNFSKEHSSLLAKVDSGRVVPNSDLTGELTSIEKINSVGSITVKSEPLDGNAKHVVVGDKGSPVGLFDFRTPKCELAEKYGVDAVKLSTFSPPKLVEPRSIKSEPVQEVSQEKLKTTEGTSSQSDCRGVQCQDNCSYTSDRSSTPQKSFSSTLTTCSTYLTTSGDLLSQSECSTFTKEVKLQEACGIGDQVASEAVSVSINEETNVSGGIMDKPEAKLNADDPEPCRLRMKDEIPLDSQRNAEGSVTDEEKINISNDMLEDSYCSDCESDGNHALVSPMHTEGGQNGGEDDEFEDGEVREPPADNNIEGLVGEKGEAENVAFGDYDIKKMDLSCLSVDDGSAQSHVGEKPSEIEECGQNSHDHSQVSVSTVLSEKTDQVVGKDGLLQESSTAGMVVAEANEKRPIKATRKKLLDRSEKKNVQKGHETEVSPDGATNNGSQGTVIAVGEATGEAADVNKEGTDTLRKDNLSMPKIEASQNSDGATKDVNSGGNRSRIIKLPRDSSATSPVRTRSIPVRSLPSQIGRTRYTDFEGDKLHPRGNRDEMHVDGHHKFMRERIVDQSVRSFRGNFVPGRGRVSGRLVTQHGEWNSDCNFAPEIYNGSADYRFPRHKRGSAFSDAGLECNGHIFGPDDAIAGADRGGRRHLSDELPSLRHPSSRRRSPGGRDGPTTRGVQMIRRVPRNIGLNRCIGEDGSDLVGLRHGERFSRGLPDDVLDPIFSRPQPYDEVDVQFVGGNRNFSSVQRRGIPRIRSKSPIRSTTHSPGHWSPPRRRSQDGFNGLPEFSHRRSPAIYRIERMRSPDFPFLPEDIAARRHGSPPYMARPSNNLRDMDSGREHGHPRSIIPRRRSPSDRVLPRNTRRLDILDPRERANNDEYFGGPMQSGRLHELGTDGSGDERRKLPLRSFRSRCGDADGENFRFHVEDGLRPLRFCPEADSDLVERSHLRERDFDRRIKRRPVNAPRRMTSIEEQEGSYGHSGQVWHDDGFDEVSCVKRRRF